MGTVFSLVANLLIIRPHLDESSLLISHCDVSGLQGPLPCPGMQCNRAFSTEWDHEVPSEVKTTCQTQASGHSFRNIITLRYCIKFAK